MWYRFFVNKRTLKKQTRVVYLLRCNYLHFTQQRKDKIENQVIPGQIRQINLGMVLNEAIHLDILKPVIRVVDVGHCHCYWKA